MLKISGAAALCMASAACSTASLPVSMASLPVSTEGATYAAVATGIRCVPGNGSISVSGTLTGAANVPAYVGVSAQALDSGSQIGSANGPILTLDNGQSQTFNIRVSASRTPTSCRVSWYAGPPPTP